MSILQGMGPQQREAKANYEAQSQQANWLNSDDGQDWRKTVALEAIAKSLERIAQALEKQA